MTMANETDTSVTESQAPIEVSDESFRTALAERLGMDTEPRDPAPQAAPSDQATEPSEASDTPEPRDAPRRPQPRSSEYAFLRAPELRQHLTRREQELQDAHAAKAKLETELAELRGRGDEFERAKSEAVGSFGSDEEFSRLHRKVQAAKDLEQDPSYYLTDDEMRSYERMHGQRTHAASLLTIAQTRVLEKNLDEAKERIDKHGLDPRIVNTNPGTGALIDHAVDVTTKRVTEQFKDTIAEKDAEIKSLHTQVVGKRSRDPGVGGRAGPSDAQAHFGGSGSPDDNIRAGIRLRVEEDSAKHGDARLLRR